MNAQPIHTNICNKLINQLTKDTKKDNVWAMITDSDKPTQQLLISQTETIQPTLSAIVNYNLDNHHYILMVMKPELFNMSQIGHLNGYVKSLNERR